MRILALDFGTQRVGIAMSDELNLIAHPVCVLSMKKGTTHFLEELKRLVEEKQIHEILVGLPVNMNGTMGSTAKKALEFAEEIKGAFSVPVKIWDERLTTQQGERLLIEKDVSRRRRRQVIDSLAAQILLQGYLDSRVK